MNNDCAENLFAVIIFGTGDRPVSIVKAVRSVTSLGLRDAKDLVDKARDTLTTVVEGVSWSEAAEIQWTLQQAGAKAMIKKDGISAVTFDPNADDEPVAEEGEGCSTSPSETVEEVFAELNKLTGLDAVKTKVRSVMCVHKLNRLLLEHSRPTVPIALNLVFTGNPGTGKTTVARLIARLYRALGLLSEGHLVEAGRSDLVGVYIGETEQKCTDVLLSALGGVLFIDEAYSLSCVGYTRDHGNQVINLLVQFMENHRDNLAVVAAGYPNEMQGFIDSNPGLQSRFQTVIEFRDFSTEELVGIFNSEAADHGITASDEVSEALRSWFEKHPAEAQKGNGRLARNLFAEMVENMAVRLEQDGPITQEKFAEGFNVDDIPEACSENGHTPIGFAIPG